MDKELTIEETLEIVYEALLERGHDPVAQLTGYMLSEDPLYLPDWHNARGLISYVDRDELLKLVIEYYLVNRFSDKTLKNATYFVKDSNEAES